MSCPFSGAGPRPTRRGLLMGGAALASVNVGGLARAAAPAASPAPDNYPFFGSHQGGVATPQQKHTYFAAFDCLAKNRDELVSMLRLWTDGAARLCAAKTVRDLGGDAPAVAADGGSALGRAPSRRTVTVGVGPGLFIKDGADRYGLASRRPAALVDLPKFNGDQLEAHTTGGDISVQACADDPQAAFHAVRELVRLANGVVQFRWAQSGFLGDSGSQAEPRNLMGFKDGSNNPETTAAGPDRPRGFDDVVWVGDEGPDWMRGGSYLVARRIRVALEHWDSSELEFQEQVIGRHKYSGAPLGKAKESDSLGLDRVDGDGNPVIADNAHVRLGNAATNDGAQIFRRSYSYNDGVRYIAERWPPWRQGMMYDAGLFFLCYQRDPREGFIKIFENMAKLDALNQFTTHTGSAVFACPGGVEDASFIGARLFQSA
jgi:deferrochelatase/peroxidase EfeB